MIATQSQTSSRILSATKAVSDETRIRILHILSSGAFSVNEVVEILGMGQSRISRHLKILTDAGIIQNRKEGSLVYSYLPESGQSSTRFSEELAQFILSYKEDLPYRERDQRMVASILEKRERKTNRFFDTVAENWESVQDEQIQARAYRDWVLQELPNNQTELVDLGCGPGLLIPYLLPKAKHITGIDASSKMIETAKKSFGNNSSVQFLNGHLENLPLSDEACDSVVASMVLHHISHPPTVLQEVFRILKPGGVFCIVDLEKHNQEYMRDSFLDLWLGFEQELLESWITNAGFSIEISKKVKTDSFFKILQIKATKKEDSYVHSH